jgi:hypothetical protein
VTVLGLIGVASLYILYGWLLSCIVASYLSGRKGYGEKLGLAFGLLLGPIGVIVWLFWPPRPESDWKVKGPFGKGSEDRAAVKMGDQHMGQSPDSSAS